MTQRIARPADIQYISRRIRRRLDTISAGIHLDIIDTEDYSDIFNHIHPDSDEPNSSLTYLTGVRQ